jgi:hypothetical protein
MICSEMRVDLQQTEIDLQLAESVIAADRDYVPRECHPKDGM